MTFPVWLNWKITGLNRYKAQVGNSVQEKNTALGVVINLPVFQKSVKIKTFYVAAFLEVCAVGIYHSPLYNWTAGALRKRVTKNVLKSFRGHKRRAVNDQNVHKNYLFARGNRKKEAVTPDLFILTRTKDCYIKQVICWKIHFTLTTVLNATNNWVVYCVK